MNHIKWVTSMIHQGQVNHSLVSIIRELIRYIEIRTIRSGLIVHFSPRKGSQQYHTEKIDPNSYISTIVQTMNSL